MASKGSTMTIQANNIRKFIQLRTSELASEPFVSFLTQNDVGTLSHTANESDMIHGDDDGSKSKVRIAYIKMAGILERIGHQIIVSGKYHVLQEFLDMVNGIHGYVASYAHEKCADPNYWKSIDGRLTEKIDQMRNAIHLLQEQKK